MKICPISGVFTGVDWDKERAKATARYWAKRSARKTPETDPVLIKLDEELNNF